METYIIWFVLAGILVGLELITGSFFLLLYGLCCALGGLVALSGAGSIWQFLAATLCAAAGSWLLLRRQPKAKPGDNQNYDIGQQVQVAHWKDDHAVRVRYRGTEWDAELHSPTTERPTVLYIVGQRSNTWLVATEPPK